MRQRGEGRHAGNALDVGHVPVHRVQGPGEARVPDVEQDGPSDGAGPVARAHHRDRAWREQRFQAGYLGPLLPARDRVQVDAGLAERGAARDRHAQFDDPVVHPPGHGQPSVREHAQHRDVLGQRRGGEDAHPVLAGQRDQVLEEQGGHAAAMHPVRHRERDLCGLRICRGPLVAGHPHQVVTQEAEQCPVAGRTAFGGAVLWRPVAGGAGGAGVGTGAGLAVGRAAVPGHPARLLLGGQAAHAEETQIQVVRRHGLVQLLDGLVVTGASGPDGDRRAVRQQGIGAARFGERGQP